MTYNGGYDKMNDQTHNIEHLNIEHRIITDRNHHEQT